MFTSSIAFLALYGVVMGSTHSLWQALIFGSKQSLSKNIARMPTAIIVTAVVLLSFAPIVLCFLLTSSNYKFFKLLNVGVCCVAGIIGVLFLALRRF